MTLEQLLILVIFIFLPLINWLLQRAQRNREPEPEPRPPRPAREARRPRQELETLVAVPTTAERLSMPEPTRTPVDFWRREARRRLIPRSKEDLRHAIIMMTILGPCRSQELPAERKDYPSS